MEKEKEWTTPEEEQEWTTPEEEQEWPTPEEDKEWNPPGHNYEDSCPGGQTVQWQRSLALNQVLESPSFKKMSRRNARN